MYQYNLRLPHAVRNLHVLSVTELISNLMLRLNYKLSLVPYEQTL
jgi:hypothetical protein